MPKYDLSLWSDYVRGLVDPEKHGELAAHLELPGSESARRTVAAFGGSVAFAERDAAAEPPAAALRGAKALGSLLHPEREGGWLRRVRSLLVFDSAAAPLAQGVRDLGDAGRQMIFRSDGYFVDLRLEQEARYRSWAVVGQLLREEDGVTPVAGVSVLATSRDRFVGRTRTGLLGEFQAVKLPSDELLFLFLVSDKLCLEVPVGNTSNTQG